MKRKLLYFIIPVALFACGENRENATTNTNTEQTTSTEKNATRSGKSIDDMPAAIRSAFQGKYQNATVDEWESETENNQEVIKVELKQDNVEKKAYFDANGNFLREEKD